MEKKSDPSRWKRDLLICTGTTAILWLGPLIDFLLHLESPLWFPYATMPDVLVYIAMFKRASMGELTGDVFVWEHRIDPSSLLSVYNFWPNLFGLAVHIGGDLMIPLCGWILSTIWFFGLYRLAKGLGQSSNFAYCTSGIACFFAVNLAYNLNGYKLNLNAWNFALTEHLRPYPTVSAMAIYSIAIYVFYKALQSQTKKGMLGASILIAAVIVGRPFDWMVLETGVLLFVVVFYFQGKRTTSRLCLFIFLLSAAFSCPVIWMLSKYQATYQAAYHDQMWRGIFHVKSLWHYAKYTFALAAILSFLYGIYQWSLGRKSLKEWPIEATFPFVLVLASLLPHYRTLFNGITITGFSYFFVFSFSTWSVFAIAQALWFRKAQGNPLSCQSRTGPLVLIAALLIQQLSLGFGQRERKQEFLISSDLRKIYLEMAKTAPKNSVILSTRSGAEIVSQTCRWTFLPTPAAAAMISSTPSRELVARALWAEYILTGSLDAVRPLFHHDGLPHLEEWMHRQNLETQNSFTRLQNTLGHNTFIFHPRLNSYDLKARSMQLPSSLNKTDDFAVYFTPELRQVFLEVDQAIGQPNPLVRLPFKLDYMIVTSDHRKITGRTPADLGFVQTLKVGSYETWSRKTK